MTLIYKILPRSEWDIARAAGRFQGSAVDLADGYIHFSTAAQAQETAARHFAGKVFLDQQPGSYEIVRQVLGHKRIDTTTSFYSGAEVQRASTVINQLVDDLRGRHSPSPAQRQRRCT